MQLFRGQIARIIKRRSARNMRYASVVVSDGTAFAEIFLFGAQVYAVRYLENGDDVLVIGKVGPGRTAKAVTQAVISKVKDEHPEAPSILPTLCLKRQSYPKKCAFCCAPSPASCKAPSP